MAHAFEPIGFVRTDTAKEAIPRNWYDSDVVGRLEIEPFYRKGARDIRPGDRIAVVFIFHESPPFTADNLEQIPALRTRPKGVFSMGSPLRPNPVGLSIVTVTAVDETGLAVKGIDMFDGTPVLDIKPFKKN